MGCGCGGARPEVITTNVAQAIIDEQRKQTAEDQFNEMIASANKAAGNANSGATAQR
jgi:hypothetical protein